MREIAALRAVWERAGSACEWCGIGRGLSVHHRLPRGAGGTARPHWCPARLLLLCGHGTAGCHGMTESRRRWAYGQGLLVPRPAPGGDEDERCARWPFLLLQRQVVLLGRDGGYVPTGHPLGEVAAGTEPAAPPRPAEAAGWAW